MIRVMIATLFALALSSSPCERGDRRGSSFLTVPVWLDYTVTVVPSYTSTVPVTTTGTGNEMWDMVLYRAITGMNQSWRRDIVQVGTTCNALVLVDKARIAMVKKGTSKAELEVALHKTNVVAKREVQVGFLVGLGPGDALAVTVGDALGVCGDAVGFVVGDAVGFVLVGDAVGDAAGDVLVGDLVGDAVGVLVGDAVGGVLVRDAVGRLIGSV